MEGGGGRVVARKFFFFASVWSKYKSGGPPGPLPWIRHCVLSTLVINIHWILQYSFHFKEFWVIGESCISFLEGREVEGGGRGSKRRQWPSGEVVDCHASLNQRRRLGARVNHLENISGNSIWKVDVIRLFGSFQ